MSLNLKYFAPNEVVGLDTTLCQMLDSARDRAGIPFIITSGLRTPAQNAMLPNAVQDSAHLTGNAVDLFCVNSSNRYLMVLSLLMARFNRIGIYEKHVHCDNSPTLPPEVLWYIPSA